ncbi:MAG: Ig-like domain-containing protein [Bacteroidales bacterium]|nr:Ig-like domain-containing protein [Bacteroidales bacterium]
MKILRTLSLLAACLFAASVTSCVSDGLTEPGNEVVGKEIATLAEQASSVMETISDVKALQETVDGHEVELNGAIRSLESHVSYLSSGSSWEDATLATLAEQKKLAAVVGPILAQADAASATKTTLNSLDANAKAWLGKNMGAYWSAVVTSAKSEAQLASYGKKLSMWKLQIEGIASDIEAGLKEGVDLAETDALLASVSAVVKASEDLNARLAALASDVEEGYQQAIATASEDPESFDAATLKSLNKAAAADLQDAGVTMNDLIDLVAACENEVTALKARIDGLEDQMKDWDVLLDMIQSVTFMSKYSEEKVVAYYTLNTESDERTDEGYMLRTMDESIELEYIVRPASAAMALASDEARTSLWNQGLKVMGYYAQAITKAAPAMTDFTITDVTADESGIVTVTVENSLSDEFYFKKTGAKMALSVVTGKTDLASEFVEVVPVDKSGTVYAESMSLSFKSLELNEVVNMNKVDNFDLDKGQSIQLIASVSPAAAVQTFRWESSDSETAHVSEDGKLSALKVGSATVTVTSDAIDEWGCPVSAAFTVTVNPDIKIYGPHYVEEGQSINLRLESPYYIDPERITWSVPSASGLYVSIEKKYADGINQAVVTGIGRQYVDKYTDIGLTCTIEGEGTFTHTIQSVAVQPRKIIVDGMGDENNVTMKFGSQRSFTATVEPAEVNPDLFWINYIIGGDGLNYASGTPTATAKSPEGGKTSGSVTITMEPVTKNYYYYGPGSDFASGQKLSRTITVSVEPYYVTSFTIPTSKQMTVGKEVELFAEFISDGINGEDPSFTDLVWTSSAPEYVSVVNGVLTAHQVTDEPVTITASIADPGKAVKPGETVPPVECKVSVSAAGAADPKVGDYYYADGTWSASIDGNGEMIEPLIGKTLRGIVCKISDPSSVDTWIPEDFINGYVVSVDEISSALDNGSVWRSKFESWATAQGYSDPVEGNGTWQAAENAAAKGYNNTLAFSGYTDDQAKSDAGDDAYTGWDFYLPNGKLADFRTNYPVDTDKNTDWYLPSQKEMTFISGENLTIINNALSKAGKTQITSANYKTSSYNSYGNPIIMNPVAKSSTTGSLGTAHNVRFFLAF